MQKLGFSYTGAEQSAIAIFDNTICKEEAKTILLLWVSSLEESDDDVWPE